MSAAPPSPTRRSRGRSSAGREHLPHRSSSPRHQLCSCHQPGAGEEQMWARGGWKGLQILSCAWNDSEASLPAVPRHPSLGGCSLLGSGAPSDHPGWWRGTVPGLAGTPRSVGAHNSREGLAPTGAANPGQPGSPPAAQKQLKVAHRGYCEERGHAAMSPLRCSRPSHQRSRSPGMQPSRKGAGPAGPRPGRPSGAGTKRSCDPGAGRASSSTNLSISRGVCCQPMRPATRRASSAVTASSCKPPRRGAESGAAGRDDARRFAPRLRETRVRACSVGSGATRAGVSVEGGPGPRSAQPPASPPQLIV